MGGRTMPTECPHGVAEYEFCEPCDEELIAEIVRVNTEISRERRLAMHYAKHFPAEAVAQLVADGVLVPACWLRGGLPLGDPRQRDAVEGSRPDGEGWELMYGVVLPEEGE